MAVVIEGFYKEGKIEFRRPLADVPQGPVRVIVMHEPPDKSPLKMMTFGRYPGDQSTPDDFRDYQWRGEAEWDDADGQ